MVNKISSILLFSICCAKCATPLSIDSTSWTGHVYLSIAGDSIPFGHSYGNILGSNSVWGASNYYSATITDSNFAAGGSRWIDVASTQTVAALSVSPRWLFVHAGVNDVAQGSNWSGTVGYIYSTLTNCQAHNTRLIIDEILPDSNLTPCSFNTALRDWNTNYALFTATNTGIWFFKSHDAFGTISGCGFLDLLQAQYDSGDGIHINPDGYSKWAYMLVTNLNFNLPNISHLTVNNSSIQVNGKLSIGL